ncbi:methyltransferase domain-containing protein [Streptomyces sp. MB22_4]|uniref:class I SAM-dependent methyltransferase n=1 Tax=Streptomyces sp. MB22_4 TaxID=3383120 RepID=UPI0039A0B076
MSTAVHETRTAGYWNGLYDAGYTVEPPTAEERQMLRVCTGARSGMRALDIGCGRGQLSAHMADWGMDVTGTDFSLSAITAAREMHPQVGELLDFHLYDVTADRPLVPNPGPVDIVVCRLSMEFVDSPRFMNRVRRWLTPNGVLHITTTVAEAMPQGVAHRGLSRARIAGLRSGWAHMTVYPIAQDGSLIGVVLRG